MFTNFKKKVLNNPFVYQWQGPPNCSSCTHQFTVLRRKKVCMFCQCFYCADCVFRRNDKKISCRKCDVLMTRPLDRKKLLKLKNRDLVNYLSSRHISTSGCIEKEDLVNAVLRSVNDTSGSSPRGSSCPTSPTHAESLSATASVLLTSRSEDDVSVLEGIRVHGHSTDSSGSPDSSNDAPLPSAPLSSDSTSEENSFVFIQPTSEEPILVFPDEEPLEQDRLEVPQPSTDSLPSSPDTPRKCPKLAELSDIDELVKLNVRELKILLITNRISIAGCVERDDLIEKAKTLYLDYWSRREDLDKLAQSDICKICMDAPIECVLLECGHMATCLNCGKQLSDCPICRRFVVRCVRTFKA